MSIKTVVYTMTIAAENIIYCYKAAAGLKRSRLPEQRKLTCYSNFVVYQMKPVMVIERYSIAVLAEHEKIRKKKL